jgi:hypothetical protein
MLKLLREWLMLRRVKCRLRRYGPKARAALVEKYCEHARRPPGR